MNAQSAGDVVVTGVHAVCGASDPSPFLRHRKLRKYMGLQDELAVAAAGGALAQAGLEAPLGERCGLFLTVGYIPFEKQDIDGMLAVSVEDGRFSMPRFSRHVFDAINPLLTFRVLPNMPAFHVSLNFDIQGPYAVSYPGIGQFYGALDDAVAALGSGAIDVALVGGVADQRNFLVEHHFSRIDPPLDPSRSVNGAACLVMELSGHARARNARPRAIPADYRVLYVPRDPFAPAAHVESWTGRADDAFHGPSSLGVAIAQSRGTLTHEAATRDGFDVRSTWEVA